jgi:hypothetical protein
MSAINWLGLFETGPVAPPVVAVPAVVGATGPTGPTSFSHSVPREYCFFCGKPNSLWHTFGEIEPCLRCENKCWSIVFQVLLEDFARCVEAHQSVCDAWDIIADLAASSKGRDPVRVWQMFQTYLPVLFCFGAKSESVNVPMVRNRRRLQQDSCDKMETTDTKQDGENQFATIPVSLATDARSNNDDNSISRLVYSIFSDEENETYGDEKVVLVCSTLSNYTKSFIPNAFSVLIPEEFQKTNDLGEAILDSSQWTIKQYSQLNLSLDAANYLLPFLIKFRACYKLQQIVNELADTRICNSCSDVLGIIVQYCNDFVLCSNFAEPC